MDRYPPMLEGTFADLSTEIRYVDGYTHPDREEDLLVDDAQSLEQLLAT